MDNLDFKEVIEDSELWIKQKYIDSRSGISVNAINLLKGLFTGCESLETKATEEVWEQSFVLIATGDDLDKLGKDRGIFREGDTDSDYRDRIIEYENIKASDGATLKVLKDFIEDELDYTINNVFIVYDDGYDPSLGGNGDGTTGDLIFTTSWADYRNFLTFIELNETLTDSDIEYLESKIKPLHKVNNFVHIREDI